MGKKSMLTRGDDLTLFPPEDLQQDTLAKMEEASRTLPVQRRKTTRRRLLSCAALVGAMFMLMGVGHRITANYMTFAAGHGVVKEANEDIYTLVRAERFGTDKIDAVSMVPVTEGEYAGQWKVTVMTTLQISTVDDRIRMQLHHPDGTEYDLLCTRMGPDSVFTGYIDNAAAGTYTACWDTFRITLEMDSINNSAYAAYRYPTSDSVTVVCFPIAEGSDKLIVRCSLTPKGKDMKDWAEHSSFIRCIPEEIKVTDTAGNEYTASSVDTLSVTRTSTTYITESIFQLCTSAPGGSSFAHLQTDNSDISLASLQIENIHLTAELQDMPASRVTIPEKGESVSLNTTLIDTAGLQLSLLNISNDTESYQLGSNVFPSLTLKTAYPALSFAENITLADIKLSCRLPDDPESARYVPFTSTYPDLKLTKDTDLSREKPVKHTIFALGSDDPSLRSYNIPAKAGDTVEIVPIHMTLTLSGDWTIHFGKEADRGIPKEAIKYGK
ncbi:MAG: hypothetical protein IKV57_10360 [Clostridia bacterium]|nr:hypothetical protein [Clostridia bacterium]